MRKLLNKPWFVAGLALAALAFVGWSFLPGRVPGNFAGLAAGHAAETDPAEAGQPGTAAAAPAAGDELVALTGAPVQRDPFAPSARAAAAVAAVEKAKPDLLDTVHLSAIWSQDGAIYVLLNGRIQQPGDEIGRLKIETVSADGVWLAHWKGRDHLELGGNFTLRTPAAGPVTPATL